ncbi:hypothetical protein LG296_01480 [Ureibacillus chungkukjangi]|uniref:hypothetical protein n=1 Tax=Ureibacillus chungkukjangi TaxID=1202712 RepID=UPI0038511AB4
MTNSINKVKAIELAEKLGLKVSFEEQESKIVTNSKEYQLEDFFPELQELNYVTKDTDCFVEEIILKHSVIKVEEQQVTNRFKNQLAMSA